MIDYETEDPSVLKTLSENWHHPISRSDGQLHEVLDEMTAWKINPKDVPLIIKLVENPKYSTSNLFTGAVDLFTHDCIHIVLGRGILPKDEAFVIGFTMGSTKRVGWWRRNLFMFVSKYLYPDEYRFGEEERFVFSMGVMAGSLCETDLSEVKFCSLSSSNIGEIRDYLKINTKLLKHCYALEKKCFPNSKESSRLLKTK